jgi:hypothetical protein
MKMKKKDLRIEKYFSADKLTTTLMADSFSLKGYFTITPALDKD